MRVLPSDTSEQDQSPFINQATIKAFNNHPLLVHQAEDSLASAKAASSGGTSSSHVDILMTNLWPPSISRLSNSVSSVLTTSDGQQLDPTTWSAPPLDSLVQQCKPRYHFASAGGSFFWEREPFIWDGNDVRVARFVNLGAFGSTGANAGAAKKPRVSLIHTHSVPLTDCYIQVVLCVFHCPSRLCSSSDAARQRDS